MNYRPRQGLFERELPYPETTTSLYRRLRHLPQPVLLSSGDNSGTGARYDILTAAPLRVLRTFGPETRIQEADGAETRATDDPIDLVRRHFDYPDLDCPTPPGYPFVGGAVGYFGYDLLHPWQGVEASEAGDIPVPAMQVGLYHWAVVVDHAERRCRFAALPTCPAPLREEVLDRLLTEDGAPPADTFRLTEEFISNFTRTQYLDAFQRIIDYIHAGDCYQVNLAQRFTASCEGDPLAAFERLQGLANAPFAAFMEDAGGSVLSFSPERFLTVRNRQVVTQPIKGTRPRHADPAQDRRLHELLAASPKDRAENLMIVDLLRNDLGRVCQTGSVKTPALFEIQSFRNVHHMVSTVEGRLERADDVFALLRACFPGGSITGAPKLRAMQIIRELETRSRSVYCGSIGYIGFDGSMDTNICIRTLVHGEGRIHCWGGGGIVADSVGDAEYQETLDKISLFLSNLG